jgi:hypothetical protein
VGVCDTAAAALVRVSTAPSGGQAVVVAPEEVPQATPATIVEVGSV